MGKPRSALETGPNRFVTECPLRDRSLRTTPDNAEGGRNLPTPFVIVMSDVLFAVTLAAPMLSAIPVPRARAVVQA